ncbi:hypothetical protein DM867_08150 [Halosegnis rubeus]|jgi:hypothetical protein|uniref:Uncharacterized protein n=1 Tax=Halosegnis rubeus TaxID=2212850 RepID=A0A5N5UJV4_9EURY|nr:hypothetical protein [Halosegnis rubeus]KAB7513773.1 hypothetical protein DM867_08150 [Halosegnis rubeus]KAB7518976.1 hypothetical protein DP108_07455 [Halosegnis rubeus]
MVGPISSEERDSFAFRVKAGLTAIVALSAGLIAVQAEASPVAAVVATLAGAAVGAPLIWLAIPGSGGRQRRDPPNREFRK